MTFKEVLNEVIDWLQKEKRISYRALKRQFDLDEEYIEDLKEALIFGNHAKEDLNGLVWNDGKGIATGSPQLKEITDGRFFPILRALIVLLQHEKHISYHELKVIFGIDDDFVNQLREDLELRQLAHDKEGKILVWNSAKTGEVTFPGNDISKESKDPLSSPQVDIHDYSEDAERRQLTVMFCDLAGSTALSQQLDPEVLREVIQSYQSTAAKVILRYEGHIAQYLGDGLLVYFGWPLAHEDDAKRSVLSGMEILEMVQQQLNPVLKENKGVTLDIRIGIHTGLVVVGKMGGEGRHEILATGETVNVAARLEALAGVNTVAISKATERLVRHDFVLDSLGKHTLKGISDAVEVFRVESLDLPDSGKDENGSGKTRFMVGRDEEMGILFRRWDQVKEGFGQVVLIIGTAGIGKSILIDALKDHIRAENFPGITFRCSSYHQNSALYPVITTLERILDFEDTDTEKEKLEKLSRILNDRNLPVKELESSFATLLSLPVEVNSGDPPQSPLQTKQKILDAVVLWLVEEAQQRPILIRWEDLHWADPSTLELLDLLMDQVPTVSMLSVMIFRPEFTSPWKSRSHLTPITLNRLERKQINALAAHHASNKTLPAEVLEHIISKTDGVPLFVEELTKMLLESDILREEKDRYLLTGNLMGIAIPETLQDSLMARLDQLKKAKEMAQVGAILGREFSYELIEAIWPQDKAALHSGLNQLVEADMLYRRGRPPKAIYIFKHALIQDAAYSSLLKSKRQELHNKAAKSLETRFREISKSQPELVAQHYTEAGDHKKSVGYWLVAGRQARQQSAHMEAVAHLTKGLEALKKVPPGKERNLKELDFLTPLGNSLIITKGYASQEVGTVYARARELCNQTNNESNLFSILFGLISYYVVRGENEAARKVAEETQQAGRESQNPIYQSAGYALGMPLYGLAQFTAALEQFEQGISGYSPEHHKSHILQYGMDLGIFHSVFGAHALWQLGFPDQALEKCQESIQLAKEMGHPFSLALARAYTSMLLQFRRDVEGTKYHAEETIRLSEENHFDYYFAWAKILRGWALGSQDQEAIGKNNIKEGLDSFKETGTKRSIPYYLSLLAQVEAKEGNFDKGLETLSQALDATQVIGELWWTAEIHRLQGEFLLQKSINNAAKALSCFQKAIEIARIQKSRSLEIRAANSLAAALLSQDKTEKALQILSPVYNWFSEGFETFDLIESKRLLDQLL